ncbi:hypothetical protein A5651_02270 [Mycobacterium sp. 1274761.0]|nr:hypothetical protein A5651_02270 [Mycobacterium sp. 1274761.0]
MYAPARTRSQILVVVAQVPHQIGGLVAGGEMVCDAGDPAQCVVGVRARGVDLADDRMLGARHVRQRRHRRADTPAALVMTDGIKRAGRIG